MRITGRLVSLTLIALGASLSCQKTDVTGDGLVPVSFSSVDTKAQLKDTQDNFKVWATRVADANTALMSGYRVNYSSSEWTYTEGTGTESQSMKYWDTGSSSFRFHAGAPCSAVADMSADALQLSLTTKTAANDKEAGISYYSTPTRVLPANFGKTVALTFKQVYAKVEFSFRIKNQQTAASPTDYFYIKDITIKPADKKTYPLAATCDVTYDWDAMACSTSYSITSESAQSQVISLGQAKYTAAQTGPSGLFKYQYLLYVVPTYENPTRWTLSLKYDGVEKVYTFSAAQCAWAPGKHYTYKIDVLTDFIMVSDISVEDWIDETLDIVIEGE